MSFNTIHAFFLEVSSVIDHSTNSHCERITQSQGHPVKTLSPDLSKKNCIILASSTAILVCKHVNGPDGSLIHPRLTIHVTFSHFSHCSDNGVFRITTRLA